MYACQFYMLHYGWNEGILTVGDGVCFDLYGIFLPALLVWALLALPASALVRRLLRAIGVYRWVWHPALFDLALLMLVFAAVVRPFGLLEV